MGTRPSRVVFLLSFFIGLYAILNEYVSGISWQFLGKIGATNWILLMIAFVLLLAGVVFRKF
ncbi:MAG: hypothetical protein AB1Z19_07740 [Eubacteriales bacterium]